VTIAEETFAVFIERVVFLWRQRDDIGKRGAVQNGENQEGLERLVGLHQAGPKDLSDISLEISLEIPVSRSPLNPGSGL